MIRLVLTSAFSRPWEPAIARPCLNVGPRPDAELRHEGPWPRDVRIDWVSRRREGAVDDDVPSSGVERTSRVLDVGKGFTWWTTVDVFAGGGAGMSEIVQAIRSSLECMRIGVRHWPIANEGIASGLFSGAEGDAPYVVVAMHGDHGRLLFLPSSPASGMKTSYSVEELAGIVRLPGKVVVSVGCASGSPEFAEVFLAGGASAYIAPVMSPFGHAAPDLSRCSSSL